jgi:hypothetical protein
LSRDIPQEQQQERQVITLNFAAPLVAKIASYPGKVAATIDGYVTSRALHAVPERELQRASHEIARYGGASRTSR